MVKLRLLFRKYVDGNMDDDEYKELLSFLQHPMYKKEIIKLIQEEFLLHEESSTDKRPSEKADEILKNIFESTAIYSSENRADSNAKRNKRKLLWKISVAAAIVLFLGVGIVATWRLNHSKEDLKIVGRQEKPASIANMTPATNAAVLTLADGRRIVLDSSKNGLIAKQGQSKILNAAGKLNLLNARGEKTAAVYNNTLCTNRANVYQIVLSDGTKVWLNAVSSLTFPNVFAENERRISITGEAYLEVAKNPLKPFIVNVNGVSIKVLGTHFNVDAYNPSKVSTTLLEGSVAICSGENNRLIKPGESADATGSGIFVRKVNIDKIVAWKNREFYFDKDPLTAIMRELSRWYDIDIQYEGGSPDNKTRYSGSISRNARLSDALLMLHNISNADFRVEGRTVIVKIIND